MPFELSLPSRWKQARWKVKIREKEIREPPHVTILCRTRAWRIDLRTGEFMDRRPDPGEVPVEIVEHIKSKANWQRLRDEWNRKYPRNPIQEGDSDNGE